MGSKPMSDLTGKVIEGMPEEDYHGEREHLSSSVLRNLWEGDFSDVDGTAKQEDNGNESFKVGSAFHCAILEGREELDKRFYISSDIPRKGTIAWRELEQMHGDKTILSGPSVKDFNNLMERWDKAILFMDDGNCVDIKDLIQGGRAELSLFTELEGYKVKCRFDYVIDVGPKIIAYDLKSTRYGYLTQKRIQGIVDELQYDIPAGLYTKIGEKLFGKPVEFKFIIASKYTNHVKVVRTRRDFIEQGWTKCLECFKIYSRCKKYGKRMGYTELEVVGKDDI